MVDAKAPELVWDGNAVRKVRASRPMAVVVPDWDHSHLYRVRLRDGRVSEAMPLPQARSYAWQAAGGQ